MTYYKAMIRVVKSLIESGGYFGTEEVLRETIQAESKDEVKSKIYELYPQFFPSGKVWEKESKKDEAQFFYVIIYPLYNSEVDLINEGSWLCDKCGTEHENKYEIRPFKSDRVFNGKLFCNRDCYESFAGVYNGSNLPDDLNYIKSDSPNYIYKITEKSTRKCYIGKTRNEPFFRWWNHLKHSGSPFGVYLRSRSICEFTFEVIEVLPSELSNTDVLARESYYIILADSIKNGFNSVISNKVEKERIQQPKLF